VALEALPSAASRWWRVAPWAGRLRGAAASAAIAVLVYIGSLWNGFAYDDAAIIPGDPRVVHFKLLEILRLPYWHDSADLAIYRPLTTLSFAVDWFVSRGYPSFFHAVNVAEHGIVTALVFLLLAELFTPAAAFAGALLFALHPVHVEAVANVVGRAEIVSAIFYLGAILLWVRGGSKAGPARMALLAALYAIALFHKESSATLPAALVLFDAGLGRWRLERDSLRAYVRRILPLMAVMACVLAAFVALRFAVLGRMAPAITDPIFDLPMSPLARVMTALQAWPVYLRLLFFPVTLLADYGPRILMPAFHWTPGAVLGLVILPLVIGLGFAMLRRGRRRTALGLLWFPLTVLPVSNLLFPIGIIVAERTLYLPMMAICVAAAAVVEGIAGAPASSRRALAIAGPLLLAALAFRTVTRVPVWSSTDSVFWALNSDAPQSFRGWWHLARIARRDKKLKAVEIDRYQKALTLWPYRRALVIEAISEEIGAGRAREARRIAAFAVKRWPRDASSQRLLAATSLGVGDTAAARAAVRAGLAVAPRDSLLLAMARAISPAPPAAPPRRPR
jgi:hypothetical protein